LGERITIDMMPFVLLGRKKLPPESAPSPEHTYDDHRQLWIDKTSGEPLVSLMKGRAQPTQFGETTFTESREGADQTEGITFEASQFGETTLTKTREGADQSEGATPFRATQFGETTHTATREGVDQAEGVSIHASQFGETTSTRTREGADQTEGTTLYGSQFGETSNTKTREGADQIEGIASVAFNAPHSHF
jgi:hypothetical protein